MEAKEDLVCGSGLNCANPSLDFLSSSPPYSSVSLTPFPYLSFIPFSFTILPSLLFFFSFPFFSFILSCLLYHTFHLFPFFFSFSFTFNSAFVFYFLLLVHLFILPFSFLFSPSFFLSLISKPICRSCSPLIFLHHSPLIHCNLYFLIYFISSSASLTFHLISLFILPLLSYLSFNISLLS